MDRDLGRRVLRRTVCALPRRDGGRQLEGLKADFIATASHELRTPLAAV
jgi:signal transduction histidine kinase